MREGGRNPDPIQSFENTISILWKVSGTLSLVGASGSDCTSVTEYPLLLPGTHPVILEEALEELCGIL